jgi:hypothetical protein
MKNSTPAIRADVYLRIDGRWTVERAACPVRTAYAIRADLHASGHSPADVRVVATGLTVDGAIPA